MPTLDPPLSREALLEVFCEEARARLERAQRALEGGIESCDYDAVHQEFDSLHGGARAVDLPWLEHHSRVVAGYARFLRGLKRGLLCPEAHDLLRRTVTELASQYRRFTPEEVKAGCVPDAPQVDDLLNHMLNMMRDSAQDQASPCTGLPGGRAAVLLVVDDSATSRLLFRIHLPPEAGCAVHEAQDAAGAVREALARNPDVVFLDYNMPDTDGVSIARAIRAAGLNPCFILLTANVQQSVLDEARAAGFAGVLEKPVNRAKIASVLNLAA